MVRSFQMDPNRSIRVTRMLLLLCLADVYRLTSFCFIILRAESCWAADMAQYPSRSSPPLLDSLRKFVTFFQISAENGFPLISSDKIKGSEADFCERFQYSWLPIRAQRLSAARPLRQSTACCWSGYTWVPTEMPIRCAEGRNDRCGAAHMMLSPHSF